jgi:hypothetical protein
MGKHEKRIGVKPFLDEQTQAHHKPGNALRHAALFTGSSQLTKAPDGKMLLLSLVERGALGNFLVALTTEADL